jgi:hypothetical protein
MWFMIIVKTLALGSRPRQGFAKVRAKCEAWKSHFMLLGMWEGVKEGTPFGVSGQNDIWVLVLWPDTKYTIRGKVVASPKSRTWWVLWICVCPWLVHASKCFNYTLTNLLFSLCRSVWVIELLVNVVSPYPRALARPSTPEVLRARECTPTLFPSVVFIFGLVVESFKELGVRQSWALICI